MSNTCKQSKLRNKTQLFLEFFYFDIVFLYFFISFRKRYHHAEKEFVESKLNLHIKQERKELLTEHLMTIIQESEDRKSKKLVDLMNRLQIEDKDCDT